MKAMRIHGYGDVSVIHHDEVPRPVPREGEVLVHVAATSFNPSEVGLRRGALRSVFAVDLPYTLGNDVAGTVVEVGPGVRTTTLGKRVIGRLDGGAAADYAIAPAAALVAAPATIALTRAAAIPIAGVTAWQAVFEHADITRGQHVLINGTGAVGRIAIQLARQAGAQVSAIAGPRTQDAVRQLGAEQVVDYTATAPADAITEPIDALLNFAAIDIAQVAALAPLIRDGGVLVSATTDVERFATPRITATHFVVRNDTDHLTALVKLIDAGAVRIDIAASRPLGELPQVHRDAESGRLPGKTILLP